MPVPRNSTVRFAAPRKAWTTGSCLAGSTDGQTNPRSAGATLPGWHCRLGPLGLPPCWVWKHWVAWWMAPGAGKQAGSRPAAPSALQGGVQAGSWLQCWALLEPGAAASETADPPAGSWWGRWWAPGAGNCQGPAEKSRALMSVWLLQAQHNTQLLYTSQTTGTARAGYRSTRDRQARISLWRTKPIPLAAQQELPRGSPACPGHKSWVQPPQIRATLPQLRAQTRGLADQHS